MIFTSAFSSVQLKSALKESRKNANLLSEYHELYELQRKRLERTVDVLASEKEIWSAAAYNLALKVGESPSDFVPRHQLCFYVAGD